MNDSRHSQADEKAILRYGWLVEGVPYFLLGTFMFGVGVVALVLWCAENWKRGAFLQVSLVACGAAALVLGFALATRRKRPVLALAFLLVWAGFAAYVMADFGWVPPGLGS